MSEATNKNTALAPTQTTTVASSPRQWFMAEPVLKRICDAAGVSDQEYAKRMAQFALTAMTKTPDLAKCSKESVLSALIDAAALRLPIDGTGQAYLVPFNKKASGGGYVKACQLIIGYKGLISLAFRSNRVSSVYSELVYTGDEFAVRLGTDPSITHVPKFGQGRGTVIAGYAVLKMKDGGFMFDVMTVEEIEAVRKRSSRASGEYSPWSTDWGEMARKTVLRRLLKKAPISTEDVQGVDRATDQHLDYDPETGETHDQPAESDAIDAALVAANEGVERV